MARAVHFGEIAEGLLAAGVESYQADYCVNRSAYNVPSGETQPMELPLPIKIAQVLDEAAFHAAVVGEQKGKIKCRQFLELVRATGCIGRTVWLASRHVTYFGRMGETHVEHFPQ